METEGFYDELGKLDVLKRLELWFLVEEILYKEIIHILNELLNILGLNDWLYKVWLGRLPKEVWITEYLQLEKEHVRWKNSLTWAKSQIWINIILVLDLFLKWDYNWALDWLADVWNYAEWINLEEDRFYKLLNELGRVISERTKK